MLCNWLPKAMKNSIFVIADTESQCEISRLKDCIIDPIKDRFFGHNCHFWQDFSIEASGVS
jgi:hypothetical protein